MKKKWCMAILALALMGLIMPAGAEGTWTGEGGALPYAALSDGTRFYLGVGDAVYVCTADGTPEPLLSQMPYSTDYYTHTPQDPPAFHCLLMGDGELLGVNLDSGMLYAFSLEPGKAHVTRTVALDFSDFIQEEDSGDFSYTQRPEEMTYCDGFLYALGRRPDSPARRLYRFDPETGEKAVSQTENIRCIAPYRDGKLLAVLFDEENAWDEAANAMRPPRLAVYDPKTDAVEERGEMTVSFYDLEGLTYSQAADTLYYFTANRVWRMAGLGQAELCAYAPFAGLVWGESPCLAAAGGSVALAGNTGWVTCVPDPKLLPLHTVTILSGRDGDAHRAAASRMGEIPVLLSEDGYATDGELFQALLSGQVTADILCLRLSFTDVQRMMDKGYCLDLSGSDALMGFVDQAYPFLQDAVRPGGTLYAVPTEVFSYGLCAYPDAFHQVGLEIPRSFSQLCDLINRWGAEGLYETYSDYQPFMWENYRQQLIRMALSLWGDSLTAQGLPLTLDAPALREALTAVDGVDASDFAQPIDWEDPNAAEMEDELFNRTVLMDQYTDYSLESLEGVEPMLLSLDGSGKPWVGMEVFVMVVNPRSANQAEAVRYLEYYCDALDETELAKMQPGRNQPILSPDYDQIVANTKKSIEQVREQLKTAAQSDIPALEEQLEYLLYEQENQAKYRYKATAESIAAYRALMEHGFVNRPTVFDVNVNPELCSLMDRYTDRQITLEQFIQEGEAKLRLMRLEE